MLCPAKIGAGTANAGRLARALAGDQSPTKMQKGWPAGSAKT